MITHHNLFAYGTLMVRQIMHSVSGMDLSGTTALLPGYRRRLLRGEVYPAILPDDLDRVEGILYTRLGRTAWQRLDSFEGEMYQRETVVVELAGGRRTQAQTYVLKPQYHALMTRDAWTLEWFQRSGHSTFVSHYRGFRQL
ncbi:MAG: gamma-glutamylcyclotransferase [Chromatiales bacterium]|jgi:gamma-glutamylcyclotransferase (GGCT)/AIG2-like uncharacterized protein YtfP